MAVIKIEDLVQSGFKYQLRVLEEHPCFVSVILFGHTPEVKSALEQIHVTHQVHINHSAIVYPRESIEKFSWSMGHLSKSISEV